MTESYCGEMNASSLLSRDVSESQTHSAQRWSEIIAALYAPISVDRKDAEFSGTIRNADVDGIQVSRLRAGPHRTRRLARDIPAGEAPKLVLCVQIEGEGYVEQGGRRVKLRAGDMTVYDTSRAYELDFDSDMECVGMVVPWGQIEQAPAVARQLSGRLMAQDDPVVRAAFNMIVSCEAELLAMAHPLRRRFVRHLVDIFSSLCLAQTMPTQARSRGLANQEKLAEVLLFIEENLSNQELNSQKIADQHFMSVRTLQAMAADAGFSLGTWVRARRLEKCRNELVMFPEKSVVEVAAAWGISNPSHFSHMFKSEYGVTPSEYRASVTPAKYD